MIPFWVTELTSRFCLICCDCCNFCWSEPLDMKSPLPGSTMGAGPGVPGGLGGSISTLGGLRGDGFCFFSHQHTTHNWTGAEDLIKLLIYTLMKQLFMSICIHPHWLTKNRYDRQLFFVSIFLFNKGKRKVSPTEAAIGTRWRIKRQRSWQNSDRLFPFLSFPF